MVRLGQGLNGLKRGVFLKECAMEENNARGSRGIGCIDAVPRPVRLRLLHCQD